MSLFTHYPFRDNANDASGNGLHFTDGTASYVAGKIGQAVNFNGTADHLYRSSLPEISVSLPWTIAFWMKRDAGASIAQIISHTLASLNRVSLQHYAVASELRVMLYDGTVLGRASGSLGFGAWYHVVLTWDGSAVLKLYINNVLQTGIVGGGSSSTLRLAIGARVGGSFPLDGQMDDLRFYDEVLPDWKIEAIYNGGKGSEECEPWQRLIRSTIRPVFQPLTGV